jgi:hypothetical protein
LTQQISYELVRIYHDPERIGALELRVATSRLPAQDFPARVLNGQASKALHLVPYLVFSRFQPDILELDLLLIDDPSESFDTSHMSLLVNELQEAAQHAQIVVESHEEEKFLPQLEGRFAEETQMKVRVTGFDPIPVIGQTAARPQGTLSPSELTLNRPGFLTIFSVGTQQNEEVRLRGIYK